MPKPFYTHKVLFDENMPPRQHFPRFNEHVDVKHVSHDDHRDGAEEIKQLAKTVLQ